MTAQTTHRRDFLKATGAATAAIVIDTNPQPTPAAVITAL